jgi:deoxyribodipyrimidine photo-lyase
MKHSDEVFPIFIHDTRAIEDFGIDDPRFGFIREALEFIDTELQKHNGRLTILQGDPEEIVERLIHEHSIDAIFLNRSYSPRGKSRDDSIMHICDENNIGFHSYQDFLLVEPHECEQRKVFTPFSLLWKKFLLANPDRIQIREFDGSKVHWYTPLDRRDIGDIIDVPYHTYWSIWFGHERMGRNFTHYDEIRNLPAVDGSTRLSPYIRFGIFSVREIYAKFVPKPSLERGYREAGGDFVLEKAEQNPQSLRDSSFTKELTETLLNELIWREFWYHIAYYFPHTYSLEFQEKRQNIVWKKDTTDYLWKKFESAETGYPLVDAAIRQLYVTNWMHNRLRMVVASFLTKNLGYDWRIGEKWFKKYLIDYDEAVNYGNWQWSASVGADPKPVRIFNPLLQSEKFDSECTFIKKYIPELRDISPKRIHTLDLVGVYHRPIVDQKESAREARERYRGE